MGRKVERTRAGKTWTEARYWSFIRGLLRRGFTRYPVKHQVKKASARIKKGTKRYEYQCAACRDWFPNSQVEVDHIHPAGSLRCADDLPGFVTRLYCEEDNLQTLCSTCHQSKTNEERARRKK